MRYPSISEIEFRWRASASQLCVIVEGETEQDDAWFYNQWFGERANDVAFFPQNGWEQVRSAVAELRQLLGEQFVFGIIDRDFSPQQAPDIPADGIFRTHKYTLENYLLDPKCWYQIVRPFTRRTQKAGWDSVEEVESTIWGLYQECIPLTSYNYTLNHLRQLDASAIAILSPSEQEYKGHPKSVSGFGDLPEHFRTLQKTLNLEVDLGTIYSDAYERFTKMDLAEMEQSVSGKPVLKLLHERFPMGALTKQAWSDTLGAYIDACPEPPPDLEKLIDLIVSSQ